MYQDDFSLTVLLKIVYKWRKQIFIVLIASIGASALVTSPMIMPPYYKSVSTFYVMSQNTSNPMGSIQMFSQPEIMVKQLEDNFGDKGDVNRVMNIAESEYVSEYIINKYDLYGHYGVDTTDKSNKIEVMKEYKGNLNIIKNDDNSIEVSFLDTDPVLAAKIANDVVAQTEIINSTVLHKNRGQIKKTLSEWISNKSIELKGLIDSVEIMRSKYGIYDPFKDNELISEELFEVELDYLEAKGKLEEYKKMLPESDSVFIRQKASTIGLSKKYNQLLYGKEGVYASANTFKDIFAKARSLKSRYDVIYNDIYILSNELSKMNAEFEADFKTTYVLDVAKPAVKKSKPIRWLVVVISTMGLFIVSLTFIIYIELYHNRFKSFIEENTK